MTRSAATRWAVTLALTLCAATGCSRDTGPLEPWPVNSDPVVFEDAFVNGVIFQAFAGSKLDALTVDSAESHSGSGAIKVGVPGPGSWAGGAITTFEVRDFSGYDALTFWARTSRPVTIAVVGLGNDNTGTSKYEASWATVPVNQTWRKYVLPIPDPAKLNLEKGLFFFSAAPQSGAGYDLWFDDIRFDTVGTITNPRPSMSTQVLDAIVGTTARVTGTRTTFRVNGIDQVIDHMPGYFDYASSNPSVATVSAGEIRVVGQGSAVISAVLGGVNATGTVTINATQPPTVAAPTPTLPAADVISLFSDAYTNRTVDTWSATWDAADVKDEPVAGNATKLYTNLNFAGIEFTSQPIDATAMTHLHLDLWATGGNTFKVKLVDFGADGVFGGGDDREHELTFDAASTPALVTGAWLGLDIPLADFTQLTTRGHLAQLILSGDTRTVYVDNIYFHR
jgi:hypothetical protein